MKRRRRVPPGNSRTSTEHCADRDEGSALVLVLVIIIISTLIVTPMLTYAVAVTRASRLVDQKAQRLEAVKGGLRTALADPTNLYKTCNSPNSGVNLSKLLAGPQLNVPVTTTCNLMAVNFSEDETKRPYGVSAVQAGSILPAAYPIVGPLVIPHAVYPGSGQANETNWHTFDTSLARVQDKIWTPNLPVHALSPRSATPYAMPAGFDACDVYFPGTYIDPINITGPTPVYFASGIYYFENTVTIGGDANVVVGGGSVEGCTTDQYAAFYATNAPSTHNITGLGSTFVFGMAGRLVVNNATTTTALSLIFNQRYVSPTDTNTLPSATVNIMSVNGELENSDLNKPITDLIRPGVLSVPYSQAPTGALTFGAATLNKYRPSTLVPPIDPFNPIDTVPIVEVNLTTAKPVTVTTPGYVDVPQGRFLISIDAGMGTDAAISFKGGVLARKIEIPFDTPATFRIGVDEVVTQLVLRIKSVTTAGTPLVVSDAMVQVNANGAYGINSWAVG